MLWSTIEKNIRGHKRNIHIPENIGMGATARIERIPIRDLAAFAREAAGGPAYSDTSPTCLVRAESQARNPHASPDDVALLVAYRDGRCAGYHGLLPGMLSTAAGLSKLYWLITFYVAPAFRGGGIGAQLVREALALDTDLAATGITPAAERVYRSLGFRGLGEVVCRRLSVESYPRPLRWLVFTAICSRLPHRRRWRTRRVPRIPAGAAGMPLSEAAAPRFHRGPDAVNWMLAHPWVVSRQEAAPDASPYYFSRVRDLFRFEAYEAYGSNGESRGAYVLSVSRHRGRLQVKLLDLFFTDAGDAAAAGIGALERGRALLAHRVELPLAAADPLRACRPLLRLSRGKSRICLYHPRHTESPLARSAGTIRLDYCDGDSAFT
jgi:GNAT superfamily N-acetyltransferase